jgi:hypothetical protein
MKNLFIALLTAFLAQAASAGAPPKVDPNAPPPDYYVEPTDADTAKKSAKKPKAKAEGKSDKKAGDGKQ